MTSPCCKSPVAVAQCNKQARCIVLGGLCRGPCSVLLCRCPCRRQPPARTEDPPRQTTISSGRSSLMLARAIAACCMCPAESGRDQAESPRHRGELVDVLAHLPCLLPAPPCFFSGVFEVFFGDSASRWRLALVQELSDSPIGAVKGNTIAKEAQQARAQ